MKSLLTDVRNLMIYHPAILVVVVMISLIAGSQLVRSQDPPPSSQTKEGKTRPVLITPGSTTDAGEVIFKPDTDHDGMNDDEEAENGTNPDDASDADGDADGDGLTNGDEVAGGSGVNSADSDGDGVNDGTEVSLGYNPTDANNTPPPNASLASLQATPSPLNFSINTFFGVEPIQLRVTGVRTDGTSFDLTGSPTLTFQSLDESVVLVDGFGNAIGTNTGATTISIVSGTVSIAVPVVVTTINPGPRGSVDIPGYANNVDIAGNYAYVAAGSAGLVIVDVTDRGNPGIIATLDTPGNANDVRIVGTTAYVADGSSGLQIIDVSTPSNPVSIGSLDTPGEAYDVVVYPMLAYVADGNAGIQIINVSNPADPRLVGAVDTPGIAKGIDVSGDIIAVADDGPGAVIIIDAAVAASPQIVGSVALFGSGLDLEVRDRFAYVAAFTGGMQVIDFSIPSNPRAIAGISGLFYPRDIALGRKYAVAADVAFFNAVPIIDFGDPSDPFYAGAIDFSGLGDFDGTGIAIDAQHIYMTGASGSAFNLDNGESGYSRLFIGEYLSAENEPTDTAGVAPTVSVSSPQSGQSVTEGDRLPISITATDDVRVTLVQLIVNGVVVIRDVAAPYYVTYFVPLDATSLTIEAKAIDVAGNASTSPPVTINVLPDPPPTVTITSPAEGQVLLEQQGITLIADANDNSSVEQVVFIVNGETFDNYSPFTVPAGITNLTVEARATDDLGHTTSATRTLSVIPDPPPTIVITNPGEGQVLFEEQDLYLDAYATDNGSIQSVVFSINGTPLDGSYYRVLTGATSLTVGATATDNLGQSASATRTVSVVPDPPPTINIVSPAEGAQFVEGVDVEFAADATDNIFVSQVEFTVNGTALPADFEAPYTQSYTIPLDTASLVLEATATDNLGHTTVASRTFNVVPDPGTTVTGQVVDTSAQPVSGATVTVFGEFSTQTGADGHFAIADVPTVRGDILARVTAVIGGQATANASLSVPPVSGGATDVGVVTVSVSPTAPTAFGVADYDGDFVPDVFVGYPDRQSLIYSLSGGQFTPSTSRLLPFGAVNSGTNLTLNFGSQQEIFAQLAGRPGSVTDLSFDNGVMQAPRTLATGLAVESEYTAAGLDTAQAQSDATHKAGDSLTAGNLTANSVGSNRTLLAFLKNGSGGTSLTVRFGDDSAEGFGDPVILPVESSVPLRSLVLTDIDHDGLLDLLVIKPLTGTDARLVVYLRTSASTFGNPIESPVTVRSAVPAQGAIDFVIGKFGGDFFQTDIAVLADDRVRIYQGDGSGAFVSGEEIVLPADKIPTGLTAFDVTTDGRSDLIVTASDANTPESKYALLYFNSFGGTFLSPVTTTYTAPISFGDTRVGIAEWGGSFRSLDLVVVDGETVRILFDIGPESSGS